MTYYIVRGTLYKFVLVQHSPSNYVNNTISIILQEEIIFEKKGRKKWHS